MKSKDALRSRVDQAFFYKAHLRFNLS
jgi:hypothetical protein